MPLATRVVARNAASFITRRLHSPPLRPRFSFSSAAADDPTEYNEATVTTTLSSYSSDWRRAVDFFRWVADSPRCFLHSPSTLSLAISILGKHFEFPIAWSLIESYRAAVDREAFRVLFHRLSAARLVDEAVDSFRRSEEFGLRDSTTFALLVDALCEHCHAVEASELCLKNPPFNFPIDTKIYNILLRGWLKMGWYSKCREFWVDMDRLGVEKDLHSYTIFMDALTKSGKRWKAVKLYKEMRNKRVSLDVVAYNTAILAVGLTSGVDRAVYLFREMQERGCRPNSATFNTIIKLLCKDGRISDGYRLAGQMRKMGLEPDVITYHCFFRNLSRPREILRLFERMVGSGCRPRMDTFVMLMTKFGRWGFLRPVFMVWRSMKELGFSPDAFAYNALIDALLQKGMVEMAGRYEKEMVAKGLASKPRRELGTAASVAGSGSEDNEDNRRLRGRRSQRRVMRRAEEEVVEETDDRR